MSREMNALVDLLQDDNQKVISAVTDRFLDLGIDALATLEQAGSHADPRIRSRSREIQLQIQRRDAFRRLVDYASHPNIDLERGSVLLSRIHTPSLDLDRLEATVDGLAATVRESLDPDTRGKARLLEFLEAVHVKLGISGDIENFFHFDNNFLHTVIERKRGIPISIITIYILLGRRVGVHIEAIGSPHRALAFFRDDGFQTYINAFDGGQLWSREDCVAFLKRQGFFGVDYDQYLVPLQDRQILERIAQNLINYCDAKGRSEDRENFRIFSNTLYHNRNKDSAGAGTLQVESE